MTHGHCLCGAVSYAFEDDPIESLHCHCESCRRATSSPMTTFVTVKRSTLTFRGTPLAKYRSSPKAERFFCGTCGSPMGYASTDYPDHFDLYVASLDDPESVRPAFHAHHSERLTWLALSDTLPRHPHGSTDT